LQLVGSVLVLAGVLMISLKSRKDDSWSRPGYLGVSN